MNKTNMRGKTFFESIMTKNSLSKEKLFLFKEDHSKKRLKYFRDDLFAMPVMSEEVREERKAKMIDLCEHFATIAKDRGDENIFHFWPKYLSYFMTPKLFDLIPNAWFTQEFGFCFACKHFKGHKKGHHKFFHSIRSRKVIGLFGCCEKHKRSKNADGSARFSNHVMPVYRCKGWEPTAFYEQILKRRIWLLFSKSKGGYTYKEFLQEQDKIDIFGFMCENDDVDSIY